ncbi:unnamed protein product [Moneuplotes crassus]|uniref:Uncharacterized protein n=1 Tax=Euplotes crassus TaxID=5936 RepID=A0AAD1XR50_EUPCR|nr:unnamed protein product [Moneuplotes crassus]
MNINAEPENFTTTTVEVKELHKMAMFHQNMIRKINRKVQKAKVENGRFFSPIRLVRKLDHLRSFQDIETEANLLPRIKSFT